MEFCEKKAVRDFLIRLCDEGAKTAVHCTDKIQVMSEVEKERERKRCNWNGGVAIAEKKKDSNDNLADLLPLRIITK